MKHKRISCEDWVPNPRCLFIYVNISKLENIQNLKHFQPQAFQTKNTQTAPNCQRVKA
jgi:hypothetical protein